MYSQCAGSKFIKQCGCRDPPPPPPSLSRRVALTGSAIVMRFCCIFLAFSIRIELTLNETSGKLIKMKSFAHENHENSFNFFLFRFHLMLLIVLLSVSKRGAVVISLWNRSELPNRRSKEVKKDRFFAFYR